MWALHDWADEWKMIVSTEKTEAALFTMDPGEAKRRLHIKYCGAELTHNQTPRFLGVTFDRTLSFGAHVVNLKKKMRKRTTILRSLAGKDWGLQATDLRQLYVAFVRSCVDYGGAAWMASAAKTNLGLLDVEQRVAARAITGCLRSTPVVALECEAELEPFAHRGRELAAKAAGRHLCGPPGDLLKPRLLELKAERRRGPLRGRLKRSRMWMDRAVDELASCGLADVPFEPRLVTGVVPPWEWSANVSVHWDLVEPVRRADGAARRKEVAERTLAGLPAPDVCVFTDGSAAAGVRNGGAGGFIVRGQRLVKQLAAPAGRFCSSYRAEMVAIRSSLAFLLSRKLWIPGEEIRVCTDSQSALRRLAGGPSRQEDRLGERIWSLLSEISATAHVTLQYVPGHAGIVGNEEADLLAKKGSGLPQAFAPVDIASAAAVIRRECARRWKDEARMNPHWSGPVPWEIGRKSVSLGTPGLSRAEAVALARLRTGHSLALRAYAHRIQVEPDATCPDCAEAEEDLRHIFECPGKMHLIRAVFGCFHLKPEEAFAEPLRVAEFLRRLGRL
jgi:ribonuclease HI